MHKFAILPLIGTCLVLGISSPALGQLLGPSEYLCFDSATTTATGDCENKDSPFKDEAFGYFHFEDFEDQEFNTPGVTADADCGTPPPAFGCPFISVMGFIPGATDSVDEDDGAIDGSGATTSDGRGQSIWARGNPGMEFTFDAAVLGTLPTHAGVVWTDGSGNATFEAFDADGLSMGTINTRLGDGTFLGTTEDDRFFGAINLAGISRIKLTMLGGGGIEVDHLQYGSVTAQIGPSCRILPRNTFLPLHFLEPHLTNPEGHPPHELHVEVTVGGSQASGVEVLLRATNPVFLDALASPTRTETTSQTGADGVAVFDYIPPSAEPFDRTEFHASASIDESEFSCDGSVVAGVGALTAAFQGLQRAQDGSASLREVWNELLVRAASGRDPDDVSPKEIVKVIQDDPELRKRLRESVEKFPPLMLALAIGRAVMLRDDDLNRIGEVLQAFEPYVDPAAQTKIAQVRGHLADRPLLASFLEEELRKTRQQVQSPIRTVQGKLPLSFEANRGQATESVDYVARTPGYHVYLTSEGAVLVGGRDSGADGDADVVRMQVVDSNPSSEAAGLEPRPARSNYLIGSDPAKWRVGVPHYARVKYEGVYPGIDLVYYGAGRQLEYDFIVAPGADPEAIVLAFEGAQAMRLDDRGDLLVEMAEASFRLKKPFVYQETDGARRRIGGEYALKDGNLVGFDVASYDAAKPLVIDPVLSYSSYFGGGSFDNGTYVAVGPDGSVYLTGATTSIDFPVASPALSGFPSETYAGVDAFVMKLDASGSQLLYSTYVGGSDTDWGLAATVDSFGSAYVTGSTRSADFPVEGPLQPNLTGARSSFVFKLDPSGSALTYSTYLGGAGDDRATSIAVDFELNVYVAGATTSLDFPVVNAIQPVHGGGELFYPYDAFVTKLNTDASEIVYSTFLGGTDYDGIRGLAVDRDGNAYVGGATDSPNFPVTDGAFKTTPPREEEYEAFITKIDSSGTALVYSTFVGGESDEYGFGLAVDEDGNAYITGITGSINFPRVNAAQQRLGDPGFLGFDGFVSKLNADGSRLLYSTYLGGSGMDIGYGIALDSEGAAYVVGETDSSDFPAIRAFQPGRGGLSDSFLVKLNPGGSPLDYSTYLGGSDYDSAQAVALDNAGDVYVTGMSLSVDSPMTFGAFQTSSAGLGEGFVAKIVAGDPPPAIATILAASGARLVAPASIASGFGDPLAPGIEAATELPLPAELLGVSVRITDSEGVVRLSQLYAVTPTQINFFLDDATALGLALVEVLQDGQVIATGTVQVSAVAAGIFTANADGQGVPAALFLRFRGAEQTAEDFVFDPNVPLGDREPLLLDFGGEDEQLFVALFGTGMRRGVDVRATIDGEEVPTSPVVALEQFVGLDQVNIGPIPRSFLGRGIVELQLTVDGIASNVVLVRL